MQQTILEGGIMRKIRTTPFACVLAFLFVLLICWSTLATVSAADATARKTPITLKATWHFPANADVNGLPGVWFGGVDRTDHNRHNIALVWIPDNTSWWPTWRLILASDSGLLPVDTQNTESVPGWKSSSGVYLSEVKPVQGHVYEPLISYNPENGALSVSLTDLTANVSLVRAGFQVPKVDSTFTISGDVLGSVNGDTPAVTTSDFSVTAQYLPVGASWLIGEREGDIIAAHPSFDVDSEAFLQLKVAGPAPDGQFHVYSINNGKRTELPVRPQINGATPFPLADLPLGKSTLTLEYVDEDVVMPVGSLDLVVGSCKIAFNGLKPNRASQSIQTAMELTSKGPLNGLDINVQATITEMVWDKAKLNYREIAYRQQNIVAAQNLNVTGNTPLVIPIEVAMPDKPGLWKIRLQASVAPDVSVVSATQSLMFNTYSVPPVRPDGPYTIAVFPDTQNYSAGQPHILTRMNQWILENAGAKNIALMLQVGDITDNNSTNQWENAQASFSQLNGLIPYAMCIGNHDMAPPGISGTVKRRGESQFMQYFPEEYFTGLQGAYPKGRLDNTYHTFNIAGIDYLVVSLEFAPPDDVLAWADAVVDSYPHHKVIVITHAYMNNNGQRLPQGHSGSHPMAQDKTTNYNDGANIWSKFVRNHENIFLVLSGHIGSSEVPWAIDKGIHGNNVLQLLVDYQFEPVGGNGWLVLLEFTPDDKMTVEVYSPYIDAYKTDFGKYGYGNRYTYDLNTGRVELTK